MRKIPDEEIIRMQSYVMNQADDLVRELFNRYPHGSPEQLEACLGATTALMAAAVRQFKWSKLNNEQIQKQFDGVMLMIQLTEAIKLVDDDGDSDGRG